MVTSPRVWRLAHGTTVLWSALQYASVTTCVDRVLSTKRSIRFLVSLNFKSESYPKRGGLGPELTYNTAQEAYRMGLDPAHTNGQHLSQLDPGELKLPALSPERKETLESIRARIDAFAEYLSSAQAIFIEAKTFVPGSDEAKKTIHDGKQQVTNALRALDPLQHLIELKPDQVTHIATHVRRASTQLSKMNNVIERVLTAKATNHQTRALGALAHACPKTSLELETSLGAPLRRTLTESTDSGYPSRPALTA